MAQYGYGLGGPAVAISEVGNSLSDLMKTFAAVKIAEARSNVEGKQVDLGLKKAQGELELSKIRAELEGEKQAASERHANLADVMHQKQLEQTGEYQKGQLGIQQGTLDIHEGELAMKQRDEARLNQTDTMEGWINKTPLLNKEYLRGSIKPELLKLPITRRDFEKVAERFSKEKPAEMLQLQAMDTHQHLVNALRKFKADPTKENGTELMTRFHNASNIAALITGDPQKMMETAIKMAKQEDPEGLRPGLAEEMYAKVVEMSKVYKYTLSVDEYRFHGSDEVNKFIEDTLAPKPAPYRDSRPAQMPQPMAADTGTAKGNYLTNLLGQNPSLLSGGQPGPEIQGTAPKILRTGTDKKTGKKVVEYEDGAIEYAP